MASSTSRFDRWASSYEDNTLQQYLRERALADQPQFLHEHLHPSSGVA
jgi:hypothetical protein